MWQMIFMGYLVGINLILYGMMAYDKRQAKRGNWRIPEKRLLWLGLLGGGLGGLIGQRQFHHKTQKPIFYTCFIFGTIGMFLLIYQLYA